MQVGTWTITANIVRRRLAGPAHTPAGEQGAKRIYSGTKHFRPGAKVYVVGAYGGMAERVVVIGPHRSGRGYFLSAVRVWFLTNLKPAVLYKPVVARLTEQVGPQERFGDLDEARATEIVAALTAWIEDERRARRAEKGHPWWVVEP